MHRDRSTPHAGACLEAFVAGVCVSARSRMVAMCAEGTMPLPASNSSLLSASVFSLCFGLLAGHNTAATGCTRHGVGRRRLPGCCWRSGLCSEEAARVSSSPAEDRCEAVRQGKPPRPRLRRRLQGSTLEKGQEGSRQSPRAAWHWELLRQGRCEASRRSGCKGRDSGKCWWGRKKRRRSQAGLGAV